MYQLFSLHIMLFSIDAFNREESEILHEEKYLV